MPLVLSNRDNFQSLQLAAVIIFSKNRVVAGETGVKKTQEGRDSIKKTRIACLEAPERKGIRACLFIEFKRARELYEKQVEEKSKQQNGNFTPTSYKASIEEADLLNF